MYIHNMDIELGMDFADIRLSLVAYKSTDTCYDVSGSRMWFSRVFAALADDATYWVFFAEDVSFSLYHGWIC